MRAGLRGLLSAAGAASAALLLCALSPLPALQVKDGKLLFVGRTLPVVGKVTSAALSSNGKRIAYVVEDRPAGPKDDADYASLWIVNAAPGAQPRRLLTPRPPVGDCPNACRDEIMGLEQPTWSLDGRFVYVMSAAWVTSPAVHQVNAATGAERFVIDGGVQAVIRTGPYRGMLLVGRHKYRPAPKLGSYDPVDVVRPDGKVMLTVPGSQEDEGDPSVSTWLEAHGWEAY